MSDLIAEGRHAAVCRVIQWGETEKGDPQVVIGFEIYSTDPDYPDADAGRNVTYFGGFTPAQDGKQKGSYDFTVEALRNMGWTGDDLAELEQLAMDGKLANEVSLVIAHEEYNGKIGVKVKWVNRPGGGAVKLKKPMDAAAVKVFAAAMKSKLRSGSVPTKPNGQQRMPARHPNAPVDDKDIPF